MTEMMDVVAKIMYSIQARSHAEKVILQHTGIRRLSRVKFLARFTELLPEILNLLKLSKHAGYSAVAFGFSVPDRSQ